MGFSPAELIGLPDLRAFGEFVVTNDGDVHPVSDAAAAGTESGLDVPQMTTLARGISGEPSYQVIGEVSATFTFRADRADRAARGASNAGTTLPIPPPNLDGSQVHLEAGPGLAAIWSQPAGMPALVVGRAFAPRAFSSGVPFETVRNYLLSLPGLPPDVATQLHTFTADGSTLPLPVPADHFTTSTAEVAGTQATVLSTRDRSMAAIVWVDDGVVTAVAGVVDAEEVLSIARNLR